ncbi:MAG: hypothetical protein EAX96_05650 [Candidatus Lokiarchaeota archaeon]|nr:hypothetical protein [Candidatus Lokiarchaeota archaeon]
MRGKNGTILTFVKKDKGKGMMVFGGDKILGYIFLEPRDLSILVNLLEKSPDGKFGKKQKKFDISFKISKKSLLEGVISLYRWDEFFDYFWINEQTRADLCLEFNYWMKS